MNKELPLYEALINDLNDGIFAVSLVDYPATESNWQCFSKQEQMYSIENEEEHIITGVIMLANTPIYRRDETGFEFNIVYTPETIKLMSEKMLKDMAHNQIDIQHDGNILPAGTVNLVEVYIKNSEKGIAPNFLKDIPDGSLIGSYKIHDDVLWNACKEGNLHGFSLAGYFDIKEFESKKKSKYSMIEKIKEKLSELLVELSAEEETETIEQVTETEGVTETVEETEAPAESEEETVETVEAPEETVEVEAPVDAETVEAPAESEEVQMAAETEEKNSDTEEAPAESEETKEEVPAETEDNSEIALIKADIDSMKNDIELAKGLYEQMKTDLESIKETLQNLVNAPAVPPVTEQFEAAAIVDKKISKAARIVSALHN